jgi:hypothetical protein
MVVVPAPLKAAIAGADTIAVAAKANIPNFIIRIAVLLLSMHQKTITQ